MYAPQNILSALKKVAVAVNVVCPISISQKDLGSNPIDRFSTSESSRGIQSSGYRSKRKTRYSLVRTATIDQERTISRMR